MSDPEYRVGEFVFTVELQNGSRPMCIAREKRFEILATALCTAGLEETVDCALSRTGVDREGAAGFAYAEEAEEGDIPPGKVLTYFMEDEIFFDRPLFDESLAEYGLAAIALLRAKGQPVPNSVLSCFTDLRQRVKEFGDGRTVVLKRRAGEIEFSVEVARDGWTKVGRSDGKSWAPGMAMIRLWRDSSEDFVQMLETGKGWERDWSYRFAYQGDEVEVYVPEIKTMFKRAEFETLASEFGLAALEGARLLGRTLPEGLEARLRAVQARI